MYLFLILGMFTLKFKVMVLSASLSRSDMLSCPNKMYNKTVKMTNISEGECLVLQPRNCLASSGNVYLFLKNSLL